MNTTPTKYEAWEPEHPETLAEIERLQRLIDSDELFWEDPLAVAEHARERLAL